MGKGAKKEESGLVGGKLQSSHNFGQSSRAYFSSLCEERSCSQGGFCSEKLDMCTTTSTAFRNNCLCNWQCCCCCCFFKKQCYSQFSDLFMKATAWSDFSRDWLQTDRHTCYWQASPWKLHLLSGKSLHTGLMLRFTFHTQKSQG